MTIVAKRMMERTRPASAAPTHDTAGPGKAISSPSDRELPYGCEGAFSPYAAPGMNACYRALHLRVGGERADGFGVPLTGLLRQVSESTGPKSQVRADRRCRHGRNVRGFLDYGHLDCARFRSFRLSRPPAITGLRCAAGLRPINRSRGAIA
jgi:hypothetical protein